MFEDEHVTRSRPTGGRLRDTSAQASAITWSPDAAGCAVSRCPKYVKAAGCDRTVIRVPALAPPRYIEVWYETWTPEIVLPRADSS